MTCWFKWAKWWNSDVQGYITQGEYMEVCWRDYWKQLKEAVRRVNPWNMFLCLEYTTLNINILSQPQYLHGQTLQTLPSTSCLYIATWLEFCRHLICVYIQKFHILTHSFLTLTTVTLTTTATAATTATATAAATATLVGTCRVRSRTWSRLRSGSGSGWRIGLPTGTGWTARAWTLWLGLFILTPTSTWNKSNK